MSHTKKIEAGEYIITDLGISSNSVSIYIPSDKTAIRATVLNVGKVKDFLVYRVSFITSEALAVDYAIQWDLEPYGDDWTIKNNGTGLYLGVDNCGGDTGTIAPKKIPYPWKIEEDKSNSDVLRYDTAPIISLQPYTESWI